ncbi:hypothetical protein MHYP_G00005580 [Metynnis hypsauchen]
MKGCLKIQIKRLHSSISLCSSERCFSSKSSEAEQRLKEHPLFRPHPVWWQFVSLSTLNCALTQVASS